MSAKKGIKCWDNLSVALKLELTLEDVTFHCFKSKLKEYLRDALRTIYRMTTVELGSQYVLNIKPHGYCIIRFTVVLNSRAGGKSRRG